jgi:hypothetical protein
MRGRAAAVWLALALGVLVFPAWSENERVAGPVFQMDYSNPGLSPTHWTLTLYPNGSGHFRSERGNPPVAATEGSSEGIDAPNVDRDIQVSEEFAERVFQTARRHRLFNTVCDSHMKVAFQGLKTISYSGPEGKGICEFNYAKDKEIQALSESLLGVEGMILEGARLEILLQHDRLGLDREMEYIVAAEGDGRVQQVGVIRGILERLADDPAVMDRVRKRARVLLASLEK